ncbi:lactonase family protein [Halomonas denitrificans]|uniref:lactonase family protein n=1 Tax=Halomonas denitrificans TaxID=370769 RepID=UPI001CD32DAB|nr:beta-propeller fold lactonase family protein [Halomonas denitrificans]MCA0973776.1 lactonase family protein [Halomonas denitrificans]
MKTPVVMTALLLSVSLPTMAKEVTGGVYVATNHQQQNSLVAWRQFDDGTLEKIGEYPTGGAGNGMDGGLDPLGSAYGVWRSADDRNVLVANIGDGTLSSLHVQDDLTLTLNNVVDAGGAKPKAIDGHAGLVYVASTNGANDEPGVIKGFTIDGNGQLTELANSLRALDDSPVSMEFTEDGKYLTVVGFLTGMVHVYAVDDDGLLSQTPVSSLPSPHLSEDRFFALPIGTKLITRPDGHSTLLVTETRYITQGYQFHPSSDESKAKYPFLQEYEGQTGSMSSYDIDADGQLTMVSADVMTGTDIWGGEQAACWVTTSADGRYAWTTNSHTSSLSTYSIDPEDGSIALLEEAAYRAEDYNEYFADMDLSADGHYVNVISGNTGKTWVFEIDHDDGSLSVVDAFPGSAEVHSYGLVTIPVPGEETLASKE